MGNNENNDDNNNNNDWGGWILRPIRRQLTEEDYGDAESERIRRQIFGDLPSFRPMVGTPEREEFDRKYAEKQERIARQEKARQERIERQKKFEEVGKGEGKIPCDRKSLTIFRHAS